MPDCQSTQNSSTCSVLAILDENKSRIFFFSENLISDFIFFLVKIQKSIKFQISNTFLIFYSLFDHTQFNPFRLMKWESHFHQTWLEKEKTKIKFTYLGIKWQLKTPKTQINPLVDQATIWALFHQTSLSKQKAFLLARTTMIIIIIIIIVFIIIWYQ